MQTQEIKDRFAELLDITRASFDTFIATTQDVLREQRPLPLAVDEAAAPAEQLQMDMALLAAAPVAAVPRYAPFHALQESGHRFLLAEDGLYLEVRRPWLHHIQQLCKHAAVAIPYGRIEAKCELDFGRISTALPQMKEFAAKAKADAPIEAAASLLWNHKEKAWRIVYPEIVGKATPGSIKYQQVLLSEDESLAIDLHSHGHLAAFFSDTDDADDRGSVKIAAVFGDLDKDTPTVAFRMCVLGLYVPMTVPANAIFG
nr:PRTRC system protein A [uncultured Massilia sp.]